MDSNIESMSLSDIFQKVNTWQDFADALPPGLVETFGGDDNFFLTMRLLDNNTPSGASINRNAFKSLVGFKRDENKKIVPLTADKADQLLDSSIKADLIRPIEDRVAGPRYAPNPLFKKAIVRFDKNEPETG